MPGARRIPCARRTAPARGEPRRRSAAARLLFFAVLAVAAPGPAAAQGPTNRSARPSAELVSASVVRLQASAVAQSRSRSVGTPGRGRLRHAERLSASSDVRLTSNRRRARYGTAELVGLVERSAAVVVSQAPGAALLVGDLSRRRGGRIHPHVSHRSGRDVDLGFFLVDREGTPAAYEQFVPLRRWSGCGRGRDGRRVCFDPVRNWALVAALMQDPLAQVQYIFVARDLRRKLLREGERQGASPELMSRVQTATRPHADSASHRSHFHVRIYCPEDDRPGCRDQPPLHAWYQGTPSLARRRHVRRRQRIR